jgi:hypothetical protein
VIIAVSLACFVVLSFTTRPVEPNISTPQSLESAKTNSATNKEHPLAATNSQSEGSNKMSNIKNSTQKSVTTSKTVHTAKDVQIASQSPTFKTESGKTFPLRTYKTLAANDPNASQWWTTSTGLESAWNIGAGSRQTTVAIIDTGFALAHEEFSGRWAINSGEQGAATSENPSVRNCTDRSLPLSESCNLIDDDYDGIVDNESGATTLENPSRLNCTDRSIALDKSCNLIDDDNNGYADDVTGWDFANYDPSVQAGETNPDGNGTRHGTEVSGILAATGNNSKGIAGVNWQTKILPLQAIDDDSYGNTLTVARAIYYAADRGVDVISISLGSEGEDDYLREAIQYAIDAGSVVVAASGNDGCNCMSYPANYPEVFAVGAHNSSNSPSSFSSFGNNLDILAPGEDMKTTVWTKTNQTSGYVSGVAGTSFATPYVSGLLSIARSHQPNATWGELTNSLLSTTNHASLTASNPVSPQLGSGLTKADSYISRVTMPQTPAIRYIFGPSSQIATLGSGQVYDCYPPGEFPTAPLYEIVRGTSITYTIDTLSTIRATASGATVNNLWRSCVGLPGDMPTTTRNINLLGEIRNKTSGKY